ncbi:MAG TPA: carboxylating nicotinate-nucleotide diphosphorylase [Microthrixaceae bacterium]|nr:carboxylating nicotinate-nucleotide diphosphorylase [Microthrixaceae bacterium]HMT23699.1 carboxylating nicotinate-nucleotide diphosphorylase [Microthrixaceae bacterium]HMT60906.1 carboxylating nicotinate-nucleotide diphosphorylase [Microthrixaceae bacterium]
MTTYFDPPRFAVREAVSRALAEDLAPLGDLAASLLDPETTTAARFDAREAGRLAGTLCAEEAFAQIDPRIEVSWVLRDGDVVEQGDTIGWVRGRLAPILTAERTALNFLGHLSGVASLTATYVEAAASGGSAQVWDTRKTTPGLRTLEKAAVRAGGGRNHRGNLSDWAMIKDNHLTGLGISDAVRRCLDLWPGRTVHVECDRIEQMVEAIRAGATAVLLDNMDPPEIVECVAAARRLESEEGRRALLEVSGNVTLETIAAYSATGVDHISIGRMTKSAPTLDIGLDIGADPSI